MNHDKLFVFFSQEIKLKSFNYYYYVYNLTFDF